jgi:hypothetical protein
MDPLAAKYLFYKTKRKFSRHPPGGTFQSSSINKVAGVGWTAKNRAILYTRMHGRILYNTTKKIAPVNFHIQTARGPLTLSEVKNVKRENHQTGSGKLETEASGQKSTQESILNVQASPSSSKKEESPELEEQFPGYKDPDEDFEKDSKDVKPLILKSFEHPVFTVKKTSLPENLSKTGTGKKSERKSSSSKYFSGISFI